MEFPFIVRLLDFWTPKKTPKDHPGTKDESWRKARAEQMGDEGYREPQPDQPEGEKSKNERIKKDLLGQGARHMDCAPGHVQQAIERAKLGKQWDIPKPKEEDVTNG